MGSITVDSAIWTFAIAANLVAALRLYQLSLVSAYRFFFGYLLVQAAQWLLMSVLPLNSGSYFRAYMITEPLLWILYFLVVRELCSLIFERYQGLYTVTRWSMYGAFVLAIGIAILIDSFTPAHTKISARLDLLTSIERGVVFSLVLYVPLVLFFLSRYPIQLQSNRVFHCILYSILFLTDAVVLLVNAIASPTWGHYANLTLLAISGACFVGWSALLTGEGELRRVNVVQRPNPANDARLLEELNAMNQTLLHVIRK